MRTVSRALTALFALLLLLTAQACIAADFSATMVTKFGKTTIPGKLYVRGKNWRQEATIDGRRIIFLVLGKTHYTFDVSRKEYSQAQSSERPWSASFMAKSVPHGLSKKSSRVTMNGIPCEKVVYTGKDKSSGSITLYLSKELDLCVKTELKMGQHSTLIEFTNIKKGAPSASLFVLPKGYKKVAHLQPARSAKPAKTK